MIYAKIQVIPKGSHSLSCNWIHWSGITLWPLSGEVNNTYYVIRLKMVPHEWHSVTAALAHLWALFLYSVVIFNYLLLELSLRAIWIPDLFCHTGLNTVFSLFSGELVRCPIVYSRDQLLARSSAVVLPHEQSDVPREVKRRRLGCRAGAARRSGRRRYKPVLLSVIMENIRCKISP